jgi:uncharacterized protein (DUF885 family)
MSHPIFEFGDRLVDEFASLHPIDATFYGIGGADDRVDDYSPEGIAEAAAKYRGWLAALGEMSPPTDYWGLLAYRVIEEYLEGELAIAAYRLADLNNIASPPQDLAMVFEVMAKADADDWGNIVRRLECLPTALAAYQETLDAGGRRGVVAAARQARAVMTQAEEHARGTSGLSLLASEHEQAGTPGGKALAMRLDEAIASARGGYATLADFLGSSYLERAASGDPVGEERYLVSAARFLGDDLDPESTYAWAWDEIARLRREMAAAANQISPGATVPEAIGILDADTDRASRDRDHFVQVMTDLQLKALEDLDGTAFHIPTQARAITVNISPPGSTLGAQYISPSEDFSRPGSVWYALEDSQHQIPLYSQVSTNYHEGFPGHHLQVVYQLANAHRLTRFHRSWVWYSGSGEGWALYAERLMLELGYFDRPEYVLNTHAESMLRACRVAIDIGSHLGYAIPHDQEFHPGEPWTFATAVEMLERYALQHPAYAESEVTRYLGWPGQAISYKVGEREILAMRETLRRQQGDTFDLREFHDRVLTPGAIGLRHLRELVTSEGAATP